MARVRRLKRDRPYYLIPIMLGMAGVLFSSQLEDTVLRGVVLLLCLAVPLSIGGNLLARVYSDGLQRFLLILGMFTLTIGAVVTVSGYSESLVDLEYVSEEVGALSRMLGVGSLLLGLLVVLYSMVRSEALIDELGDRFHHVADHMGEGFLLMDADGTVVIVNRLLTTITGIRSGDVLGRKVQDLAKAFEVDAVARHTDARSRGLTSEYELNWDRNGELLRLLIRESPLQDRRQRRVGTLLTVHDISVEHRLKRRLEEYTNGLQKLVESRTEKLHASEKRYRDLLVHMQEGFLTVDRQYSVRFANERIAEVLRIEKKDLLDRDLIELIQYGERDRLRSALKHAEHAAPDHGDQEYNFIRSDGANVPVKVSIALVESGDDDETHLSLVVTDVHELKEMHRELETRARELELANEELRELDRAKDVFLSNVSHELRTPLGTLDGYIEMLRAEELGDIEAPQSAALEVMARNVERLSLMINEMIESSRMEIRGIRLSMTLFNPNNLLHECADSAHPQALKRDIGIKVAADAALPYMWGDREKASQALSILISNAIKFSRDASKIRLSIARNDAGDIRISVSDQGIGIPEEYQEHIFRKFYQIDSSMTRHYQGTGIGLSIAKGIMEAHGGRVELTSQAGKGSTFTLVFPASVFESGATEQMSGDRLIYLAVASGELASGIKSVLSPHAKGSSSVTFSSGYDCVRAVHDREPDLIVWDEGLTDISFTDAYARLEENDPSFETPILLLADLDEARLITQALGGRLLRKPFSARDFLAQVEDLTHEHLAKEV